MNLINPDNILSVSDYAKLIGTTTQWVYRLIADNKLETVKIGNRVFIIKPIAND